MNIFVSIFSNNVADQNNSSNSDGPNNVGISGSNDIIIKLSKRKQESIQAWIRINSQFVSCGTGENKHWECKVDWKIALHTLHCPSEHCGVRRKHRQCRGYFYLHPSPVGRSFILFCTFKWVSKQLPACWKLKKGGERFDLGLQPELYSGVLKLKVRSK